jgi:hypothetical protein
MHVRRSNHHSPQRPAGLHDVNIHDDVAYVIDTTRSAGGTLHSGRVTDTAGKLHDPVMYFHPDRARDHIPFKTEFQEDVVLNLQVGFHDPNPSLGSLIGVPQHYAMDFS